MVGSLPVDVVLGDSGRSGDWVQFNQRSFPLLLILIQVVLLGMPMGMLLIFQCKIVHGMILVKPATLDTLHHSLWIYVVLFVQDIDDSILDYDVFISEVDEMSPSGFIGQAELACS